MHKKIDDWEFTLQVVFVEFQVASVVLLDFCFCYDSLFKKTIKHKIPIKNQT